MMRCRCRDSGWAATPTSRKSSVARDEPASHLSQIITLWSVVCQAHQGEGELQMDARRALIERYGGAVFRYLLVALKDRHEAEELSQEFALRFMRGDFRNADPTRGRFRNFVKTSLFHMVLKQRQRTGRHPQSLTPEQEPFAREEMGTREDEAFLGSWREELLARAWKQMEAESTTGTQPYFEVLRGRSERPELSSEELALSLSEKLGVTLSAAHARQLLHRARKQFAKILVREVLESLETNSPDSLEEELLELGLWQYCQAEVQQHRPNSANDDPR
jgi:DNA-directed RNA polymerase specialized sigma24 family protein